MDQKDIEQPESEHPSSPFVPPRPAPWPGVAADPSQQQQHPFVAVYPSLPPKSQSPQYYAQGLQTTAFVKLPEEDSSPVGAQGVTISPLALENGSVADEILAQDYEVNIRKWFGEAWAIYKQHWAAFTLFTVFLFAVAFLPYIGRFILLPLLFGIFIAVTNKIRYNGMSGDLRYDHFLFGFLFYLPILALSLLETVIVIVGLLMCIVPGLYAIFALTFAIPVFLEYHDQRIGIIGSMLLSMKVLNKHLCEMILFLILNTLFSLSGLLLLGVGILITFPISSIVLVMCFKDLYGLNPRKEQTTRCVVC